MNPSYFRIKLPWKEAVERLYHWNGKMPKEVLQTTYAHAVEQSIDENGQWKGSCLYAYENEGWTVFEDLSGFFSTIPAVSWKNFAENNDLIVAGYNDAILYGEFIMISNGVIQKEFLEIADMPEEGVNNGEKYMEINSWVDVADFVDSDEIIYSESGAVLIF